MYKSEVLFPVTQVGSWPRSRVLLKALRDKQKDRIAQEEFDLRGACSLEERLGLILGL